MFACGGEVARTPYSQLADTMSEISEHGMFLNSSVDGVSSKYILKDFTNSNEKYVNESLVIPMNFINKYQSDLPKIKEMKKISGEGSGSIEKLEREITEFKIAYNQLKNEYDRFITFQTEGSIYDGVRQAYLYEITDFTENAYRLAFKMAEVEDKVFNRYSSKDVTTYALTTKDTEYFKDYLALSMAQDFYNVLLPSVKTINYTATSELGVFLNKVKNDFASLLSTFVRGVNYADLTGEESTKKENGKDIVIYNNSKVKEIYELEKKLIVERGLVEKSLKEFSLYDYAEKYNFDLDSYNKVNIYAETYYNQIQVYYLTNLSQYTTYLKTILFRS